MQENRIVLAADDLNVDQLIPLVQKIGSRLYAVKIHNLYDEHGLQVVRWLKAFGVKVWVDAKLHDIPATVEKRAAAIKKAGADILTVHASGGVQMMNAAMEHGPKEIYAVSVLTSLSEDETHRIFNRSVRNQVGELFELMYQARVQGIVCSPNETMFIRDLCNANANWFPKLVTPGIRSVGKVSNDQQRIATPGYAVLNGSDLLVIGRQITTAADPLKALEEIECEIADALSNGGS